MDKQELNRVFQKILDNTPSTKQDIPNVQTSTNSNTNTNTNTALNPQVEISQLQRNPLQNQLQQQNQVKDIKNGLTCIRSWKWGILFIMFILLVVIGMVCLNTYQKHRLHDQHYDFETPIQYSDEENDEVAFDIVESEKDSLFQPLEQ